MRVTIADLRNMLGLSAQEDDATEVLGAASDSRQAFPGCLFVCVPGARVDGHDFAADAVARGAVALLAQRPVSVMGPDGRRIPVILTLDVVRALGRLAAAWRDRTAATVVGVTGTAGKTSVKEVLAQVLSIRGKTARNPLNLNTQIGMPVSMLNTDGDEAFWVMEAGISHEGDMDELGSVLRPDLALVLNAGVGHMEGLGSRGVAWHKARLLHHLSPRGRGLVSADYADLAKEARLTRRPVQFFTAGGRPLPYRGAYIGSRDGVHGSYRLWLDGAPCDVTAPFAGKYGAENAVAAAAAAHMLGLTAEEIAEGFAAAALPPGRFVRREEGAWTVIDDSYNANPLSMSRMLEAAAEAAGSRQFVVVLGEMLELGSASEREHDALGRSLADMRPAALFWKGGMFEAVLGGLERGSHAFPAEAVTDADHFLRLLAERGFTPENGGLILFKGSRGNRLEVLAEAFAAWARGER